MKTPIEINYVIGDFPYEEIRKPDLDLFDTIEEMQEAGFAESQMWSVVDGEADGNKSIWVYGPAHHYVNRLGYVATAEHHDGNTYYEDHNEIRIYVTDPNF